MAISKPLRFAIYARVSTEQQAEQGESLAVQEKQLREAVARFGGKVTSRYVGQEHATPGHARLMFDRMLHDVETKKVDAVIVVDASRWTRDSKRNADAIAHLQKHGARFFDTSREYSLDNDEDLLILGLLSEMHRYVARLYAKKAKFTRLERAKRGWPHCGEYPFGRVLQNKAANRQATDAVWVVDPEKYQLVRRMYKLYIEEGQTWMQLGKTMKMNPETVRRLLQFPSGAEWVRHFNDPAINNTVEIRTPIPPLLADLRHLFKAWNGKIVMHWPPDAKRLLVQTFFGPTRPRFDRQGVGVRSNGRGIFVTKVRDDLGEHWVYEARGMLGEISGALTRFPSVYDRHFDEHWHGEVDIGKLGEIARIVDSGTRGSRFRTSLVPSKRWSATRYRETSRQIR